MNLFRNLYVGDQRILCHHTLTEVTRKPANKHYPAGLCDLNPTLKIRVKFITSIAATSMAPVEPRTTPDKRWAERITLALVKRHKENVPFKQLALEFNVQRTTLQDQAHGEATRKEAHAHRQKLPPSAEKGLEDWCK